MKLPELCPTCQKKIGYVDTSNLKDGSVTNYRWCRSCKREHVFVYKASQFVEKHVPA